MADDDLTVLRAARREAWNAFVAAPTEKTKGQYLAAQSKYTSALSSAAEGSTQSWAGPPPELPEELDQARLAANAAGRAMYAKPSDETREVWRLAKNHYQNLRRKLDPEFKAKSAMATKKWLEKKKLGLPKK